MPPRKSKRATTNASSSPAPPPPAPTCPALPKKIEVVLPTPPPKKAQETSPDEALIKDLRSKLRKSQMRVREMEKVISTSMVSLVHTHPHLASYHPPISHGQQHSDVPTSEVDDVIVDKAKEIVRSHDKVSNPSAVQASRRTLRELEYSLDAIDRKMASIRKKNRDVQQRYGRIQASINRELWKAKVRGDNDREAYLRRLAAEQSTKYQQITQTNLNDVQTLSMKKEMVMSQHSNIDETVSDADLATRSLRKAIDSLSANPQFSST